MRDMCCVFTGVTKTLVGMHIIPHSRGDEVCLLSLFHYVISPDHYSGLTSFLPTGQWMVKHSMTSMELMM